MKTMKNLLKTVGLFSLVCLALTACDKNLPITQKDNAYDTAKAENFFNQTHKVVEQQSTVEYTNNYYVAQESFQIEQDIILPKVFNDKVLYSSAVKEGLTEILTDMYAKTGVKFLFTPDAVNYMSGTSATGTGQAVTGLTQQELEIGSSELASSVGVLSNVQLNMQYSGTFKDFVERIAANFNLYWEYDPKHKAVRYFRTQTKSFAVDLLPGVTSFSNSISSSSTVGGSEEGADLNSGSVMKVDYKNEEGNAWTDTMNTIQNMLSAEGRVTPNQRTGYVTVTDIPERLAKVEEYLNKINDKARKKIAVKVDVFDVKVDRKTNYAINWDAVIKALDGRFDFASVGKAALLGSTPGDVLKYTYTSNGGDQSEFLASALSQVADTSKVTGTTVYTVNGEPAPVQVVTREDYIKEVSFGALSDQSSTIESSVTPGTVISGFFMVLTPKILSDNQILLNVSMSISTSDLTNTEAVTDSSGNTTATITLPIIKSKNFMESVTLNPGQSVILSGFQEVENKVSSSSTLEPKLWPLGGNKAADHTKSVTVTLITPYIIGR